MLKPHFLRKARFVCKRFCGGIRCLVLYKLINIDHGLPNLRRAIMKICASDIRFRQLLQRFQLPIFCTNWFRLTMNWQICVRRRWTSAQSHARLRKFQRGFQRKAIFVCACFCANSKCLNLCRLIKIDQGLTNLRRVMLEICATRYSSAIVFARNSDAHFCANLLTLTMDWQICAERCSLARFCTRMSDAQFCKQILKLTIAWRFCARRYSKSTQCANRLHHCCRGFQMPNSVQID